MQQFHEVRQDWLTTEVMYRYEQLKRMQQPSRRRDKAIRHGRSRTRLG